MKKTNSIKCRVVSIGEVQHVPRKHNFDIFKQVIEVKTEDNQVLFPDIRNNNLGILEKQGIKEGDEIILHYTFEGSKKNNKMYNNIYVNSIEKVN